MCQVDVECLWGDYGVWSSMCFIKQDCWGGIGNDSVKFWYRESFGTWILSLSVLRFRCVLWLWGVVSGSGKW